MNETRRLQLLQKRIDIKAKFQYDVETATNYTDILQSYASYAGKLEAIVDAYEIELARKRGFRR